jgi:photosystem II stability/assembly factor-like uncharacterized protein
MKKHLLFFLINFIFLNLINAQGFWSPADSPNSGNIQVFAANSMDHIYGGSFDGLFRSTDNGENWQQLSPETFTSNSFITALAINSADEIFAATIQGAILKSTDNGDSWMDASGSLENVTANAFGVDSFDNIYLGSSGGIFKSTDSGTTWEFLTGSPPFLNINTIVVDENNELFAGTSAGVYQSTDGGDSWNEINNGLPANAFIQTMVLGPSSGKRDLVELFIAIIGSGVYKYDRVAQTWLAYVTGLTSLFVYSLAVNSVGDIFAGTDIGLFVHLFNASTWTLYNVPTLTTFFIAAILINRLGHIFLAEDWGGVHRSTDNGLNWLRKNLFLTAYAINVIYFSSALQTLFVGTTSGLWYKTLGQQWAQLLGPFPFFFAQHMVATAAYLFVATFNGVWRMDWLTREWTDISNGVNGFVTAMAITAIGHIFLGTFNGVFRTIDNGNSWESFVTGLTSLAVFSLVFHPAGYLFAGTSDELIFRMDLALLTWVAVVSGLPSLTIRSLAVSPLGVLFAAVYGGGIFRSVNLGDLWIAVIAGLTVLEMERLAIRRSIRRDDDFDIYAAGNGKVFRTTDSGDSWTEQSDGLNGNGVFTLGADSNGVIYAGTAGGGLFQNGMVPTSVHQYGNEIPSDYFLEQNYPNPFNPSTKIKFSITESGFTELKIYNSLGQEVETLVNKELPAGIYVFDWNADGFPSGVYFYRLNSQKYNQTKKAILVK